MGRDRMTSPPPVVVVDAANVVGSRPTGWWRDRPGAARALVAQLVNGSVAERVVVVLEGQAKSGAPEGPAGSGVEVVHAAGSGDDTIAAVTAPLVSAGQSVVVVTADRGLRRRVEAAGARVEGPSWLLGRVESPGRGRQ